MEFYSKRTNIDTEEPIQSETIDISKLSGTENVTGHLPLNVPSNSFDESIFRLIERRAKSRLSNRYGISLQKDWVIFTTAAVYSLLSNSLLASKLKEQKGDTVFFGDVFAITPSFMKNEDAEKEGNINLTFKLGAYVADIVTNVPVNQDMIRTDDLMAPADKYDKSDMESIEKACIQSLEAYDLNMPTSKKGVCYTITIVFFETLFEVMRDIIKYTSNEVNEAETYMATNNFIDSMLATSTSNISLNFYDIYEFKFAKNPKKKTNGASPFITGIVPGIRAKLKIKSDGITEE